jgi:hypothetical protein
LKLLPMASGGARDRRGAVRANNRDQSYPEQTRAELRGVNAAYPFRNSEPDAPLDDT